MKDSWTRTKIAPRGINLTLLFLALICLGLGGILLLAFQKKSDGAYMTGLIAASVAETLVRFVGDAIASWRP